MNILPAYVTDFLFNMVYEIIIENIPIIESVVNNVESLRDYGDWAIEEIPSLRYYFPPSPEDGIYMNYNELFD